MSYPINQKISPSMQASTGLSTEQLQNIDGERIRQGVNNSPVAKVADQKSNPALFLGVMLPTWLLTYIGMNKIAQASRGDYHKDSMYGKMDRFEERIKKSKAYDNKVVGKIKDIYNTAKTFVNEKVIPKSGILRAIFTTPSVPENRQVQMMAGGIKTELAGSADQLIEKYIETAPEAEKDLRKIELGFYTEDAAGNKIVNEKRFKEVTKESTKYAEEIKKICHDQAELAIKSGNPAAVPVEKALKIPFTNKYLTDYMPEKMKKAFINDIHWSEYSNKMRAVEKPGISKSVLRIIEGMTNAGTGAVGGAALVSIMGAWFITDAIVRSVKAPKGHGEKGKTFAENMLYNLGFYLTMPLGIKIMHGFGGLQYIGMKKEDIEKFRSELKAFNEKVKAGGYNASQEAEYLKDKKAIFDIIKKTPRNENWVQKIYHAPLKWASRLFTTGLECAAPFNPKGITKETAPGMKGFFTKRVPQFFINGKMRGFKWAVGGVRFFTFMLVVAPFLAKFFAKGSHLVFGKPTKSILDEGKEEKKEAQAQQQPQMMPPVQPEAKPQMAPIQPNGNIMGQNNSNKRNLVSNPVNNDPNKNLVNMYNNKPAAREMIATDKPARTYTYIPSTEGIKVQKDDEEDARINALVEKSKKAENIAQGFSH